MFPNTRQAIRLAREKARHRRQYVRLLDLDDHLLRDIGLDRDDLRSRVVDPPLS